MTKHLLILWVFALCAFNTIAQTGGYYSLNFNGSSDDVTFKDNTALNPKDEITIEAWIKPESFAKNIYENTIVGKHGWGRGNQGYVLRCGATGQASFNIASSSGKWIEAQSSANVLKTKVWHHVVGRFNGDTVSVYVNGVLTGTQLYSGSMDPSTGLNLKIGELAYGSGRNFDGDIDEVRIWNKAIELDTLKEWMCRRVSSTHPNYKNLVGYFKLDAGSGSTVKDYSKTKNKGGINGAKWSNSGAPIGDTSVYSYSAVSSLSITGDSSDVFALNNISGSYQSVHLYMLRGKTHITKVKGATASVNPTHSYGVFYASPSKVSHNVNYNYSGYKSINSSNECFVDLFSRSNLATWLWSTDNTKIHMAGDSITIANSGEGEYIFGNYGVDKKLTTSTGDSVFCLVDTLILSAPGNSSFKYQWYKDGKKLVNDTLGSLATTSDGKFTCDIARGPSCSYKSYTLNIKGISKPKVSLGTFNGVCVDVDSVVLSGGKPGGGSYYATSINKGDSVFYPSTVKAGVYQVVYEFVNRGNCSDADTQTIEVFKLPNVTAKKSYKICDNLDTVQLSAATPIGGTYTGAGISNNIFYLDSINRKLGRYTYTYNYTDGNGCSNSASSAISVVYSTPITFNPIDTSCENEATFKIKTNPNQGVYTGKGMKDRDFNPSVAGVGSHWISFTFENLDGCITKDSQIAVVKGVTKASFNASTKLCTNDDTLLLKSGMPSGGVYVGNGISNGIFDPSTSGAGTQTVAYIFTNADGCSDTASSTIVVADVTHLSVSSIDGQCFNGDEITLNNVSPTGGNYSGKGISAGVFTPKKAGEGVHNVDYSYTNSDGCKTDTSFNIEVFEAREIKFSIDDELCSNADSIDLSSTRPKNGTHRGTGVRNEYLVPSLMNAGSNWLVYSQIDLNNCENIDSIEIDVISVPNVTLAAIASLCENDEPLKLSGGAPSGGKYYIKSGVETDEIDPTDFVTGQKYGIAYEYEVSGTACKGSAGSVFWINKAPVKPTITKNDNTLTSSSDEGNQWFDKNGSISGQTNKTFTPSANGDYYVVVTNDSLCSNQSDVFSFTNSSIANAVEFGIDIYPNPSSGLVHIKNSSNIPIESIRVLDLSGKVVFESYNENGISSIDVSNLNSGAYFVHFTRNGQNQFVQKLIINKN